MSNSKSAKFYRKNAKARAKKNAYNRKFYKKNKKKANASRAERKTYRERAKRRGVNVEGKDVAHTKNGLRLKSTKANRGSRSDSSGDKRARGKKKR